MVLVNKKQKRKTIFVIEDDLDISELLQFNLRNKGFNVVSYTNGDTAYQQAIENQPDLMILDSGLPGLSGIEICRYLRDNTDTKKLPIIMLTARTRDIDKSEGIKAGASEFLTKPFSIKDVLFSINRLLGE